MSIWRWAEWLDPVPERARVTLGEGNTPLVRSRRIGPAAGLRNLYLKLDFAMLRGTHTPAAPGLSAEERADLIRGMASTMSLGLPTLQLSSTTRGRVSDGQRSSGTRCGN